MTHVFCSGTYRKKKREQGQFNIPSVAAENLASLLNAACFIRCFFATIHQICSERWIEQVRNLWPRSRKHAFICLVRRGPASLVIEQRPHAELIIAYSCPVHMVPVEIVVATSQSRTSEEFAICIHLYSPSRLVQYLITALPFGCSDPFSCQFRTGGLSIEELQKVWCAGDVISFARVVPELQDQLAEMLSRGALARRGAMTSVATGAFDQSYC